MVVALLLLLLLGCPQGTAVSWLGAAFDNTSCGTASTILADKVYSAYGEGYEAAVEKMCRLDHRGHKEECFPGSNPSCASSPLFVEFRLRPDPHGDPQKAGFVAVTELEHAGYTLMTWTVDGPVGLVLGSSSDLLGCAAKCTAMSPALCAGIHADPPLCYGLLHLEAAPPDASYPLSPVSTSTPNSTTYARDAAVLEWKWGVVLAKTLLPPSSAGQIRVGLAHLFNATLNRVRLEGYQMCSTIGTSHFSDDVCSSVEVPGGAKRAVSPQESTYYIVKARVEGVDTAWAQRQVDLCSQRVLECDDGVFLHPSHFKLGSSDDGDSIGGGEYAALIIGALVLIGLVSGFLYLVATRLQHPVALEEVPDQEMAPSPTEEAG